MGHQDGRQQHRRQHPLHDPARRGEGGGPHAEQRGADHPHHRGAQAVHAALYQGVGLEGLVKLGNQQNNHKAGQHHPHRGAERPQQPAGLRADVGGKVHRQGAGGALRHGDEVHQLL